MPASSNRVSDRLRSTRRFRAPHAREDYCRAFAVINKGGISSGVLRAVGWSETFLQTLKDNDVRLVTSVPDNVLTPLIKGVTSDNYFMPVNATREDEAIGTLSRLKNW
jgi:hypothetical protein